MNDTVDIVYVGGPTAVVGIAGVRLLLDPTFDPPGDYPIGERVLTKTQGPAVAVEDLGRIDAVLLSHDQHPDNLDRRGREYVATAPVVLSTEDAARRLGPPVTAVPTWESVDVTGAAGGRVRVTAVPALHGPEGSEHLVGAVTGFVLSAPGGPSVYVSGDNASIDLVRTIAERLGPFDAAVLYAGAARTALAGGAPLTLTSEMAAEVVELLGGPPTVVLHFEGWAHFSEGADVLRASLERHRLTAAVRIPAPGEGLTL